MLGGIEVPHTAGLAGHSDADVVLHALIDALLGASGRGDIGRWFPDTDESYRGADSMQLLRTVWSSLSQEGWQLLNCDLAVMAERPKLAPFIPQMSSRIAEVLAVGAGQIGIKAGTMEKLGFVGRGEGIAVSAVALLVKR